MMGDDGGWGTVVFRDVADNQTIPDTFDFGKRLFRLIGE